MTDLADALLAGARAAPKLDPSIIYGLAQASDPGDVPDHATGIQAYSDISRRVGWLRSEDHDTQAAYWSSIDDGERQMLQAAGFSAPQVSEPGKHRGFWGNVGHELGGLAEATLVKPAEALQHGIGQALHAAGGPLRQVQHLYRSSALITDENVTAGRGQMSLHGVFSPGTWARTWRESEHGERTFSEVDLRKIVGDRYDAETIDLAKQIAGGTKPEELAAGMAEGDRPAFYQRLADPDFQRTVQDVSLAKITFGRRLTGDLGRKTVQVPGGVPLLGGAKVQPVSGALDAVADWYADPLVIGLAGVKAAELSRYAVQTPEDVDRLISTNSNVQRALRDVSDTLNSGGAGALIERHPKLAPVATQLVREGVDSPEKLGEWFKGQAGLGSLLSGRSTGVSHAVPQMVKLNPREAAMLELKGGLKKAVDWAADTPLAIATKTGDEAQAGALRSFAERRVQGFGKFARQATSLTARGHSFDPLAADAITEIQRLGNYVLPAPRVRDIVNVWAAAPDLATKRQIYKGLLGEMFDRAGITASQEGQNWASKFISTLDEALDKPVYSASGADRVLRDGNEARRGLLEPHLTTEWAMPPFKELWTQSKRTNTLGRVYQGTINNDGISWFMESMWKPTTLLRLGFPIRAGGEELVAGIMREGPLGIVRGRAAAGAAQGEALGAADRVLPYHPLARIWKGLSGHLPDELVARIDQPADYIGAVFGDRTRRAFRSVEGALAGEDYLGAARELWKRGPLQSAFLAETSAVHARAAGYLDDAPTLIKAVREGDSARPAFFEPRGNFVNYKPGGSLYVHMWRKNLEEVADSQLGRAALAHVDDPEAAVRAVQDVILSPGFEKMAARSDRMLQTRDGRLVGEEVTREEAARDWAEAVVNHTNSIVRDEQGALIGDLHSRLAAGDVPTAAGLAETPVERMPAAVKGREVVAVSRNWARDVMDRGFQQVVGRPMDWMVRQPLFIHNYALAQREVEGLRAITANQTIEKVTEQEVPGVIERAFAAADIPKADYYHGTSKAFEGDVLNPDRYSTGSGAGNFVGPGFYMTNDPEVALSYTGKGAKTRAEYGPPKYDQHGGEIPGSRQVLPGSSKTVYGIRWKGEAPPRLIDLEQPLAADVRRVFAEHIRGDSSFADVPIETFDRLTALVASDTASGMDIYKTLREAYGEAGLPKYEVDDALHSLHDSLEGLGYDGFRYQGGAYAGKGRRLHEANVIFDPAKLETTQVARVTPQQEAGTVKQMVTTHDPVSVEHVQSHLHDVAMQRAINKTIPFIHDPQLKSQMSVVTRNLAPFWFAQEQFYKRWAKILVHSPESFRQAQLMMMGLRHSGVLHTDDQGNDYFIYPGASVVQDVITSGLDRLPGQKGKWKLPLPVGFSGQVRFATPGLERLGVPSFGPLVGVPIVGLTQMFPELEQTQQAVLGERGAGRSYWEMITPTTVSRFVHIAIDSPETSPQMASAMMQAIQYLAAAGYAPPEDAPPDVVDHWKDRVRNWTRILFLNRMVYGYAAPASPELQMDPNELSSEFRGLLKSMPIEDATGEFLRRNPDATPYTVFMSKSQSGAPLPATAQTVKFMNQHDQFLAAYPQAGGWFLPQTPQATIALPTKGLLESGNIDLAHRPVVKNQDRSISTVRSISIEVDDKEVLIPTVSDDGRVLSDKDAIALYQRTGRHLGVFDNAKHADAYAKALHEQQAAMYGDPKEQPFSIVAYREQLALELRKRKSPDQFLTDVYYAQAADQYFTNRDRKDAAIAAAKGNSVRRQAIAHGWDQWKSDYMATHPTFAAELLAPDAEIRRQETIDQLRRAATDPRMPDTPQTRSITGLLAAYNQVDGALKSMAGYTSAAVVNRRKAIRASFGEWADRYVTDHPEVKTLYQKTFAPLVETP